MSVLLLLGQSWKSRGTGASTAHLWHQAASQAIAYKPGDLSQCSKRGAVLEGPTPRLRCRFLLKVAGWGLHSGQLHSWGIFHSEDELHHWIQMCMLQVAAQKCCVGPSQGAAAVLGRLPMT